MAGTLGRDGVFWTVPLENAKHVIDHLWDSCLHMALTSLIVALLGGHRQAEHNSDKQSRIVRRHGGSDGRKSGSRPLQTGGDRIC
jgi:hypothetical protein